MWQIIGQERAVSLLRQALETNQLSHAYLFAGPPHVGKMTLALNMAQALNCQGWERPCGRCASCQKIAAGTHADVQIIGLATDADDVKKPTEISIDQIGAMQHSASLPPFEGQTRVFIIDGAETLSTEAANRLLKTLEEPESGVVFILLTSNEKLVPGTVVSRCQRVELRPMSSEALELALKEKWHIDQAQAALLARLSRGCPGWALSATTDDSLLKQRDDRLDRLVTLTQSGYDERFGYAGQLATQFSQNRSRVEELLNLWLDFWHDILLEKVGCSHLITSMDRLPQILSISEIFSLDEIHGFIKNIQACMEALRRNVNPKLALEKLVLDMPLRGVNLPAGRT